MLVALLIGLVKGGVVGAGIGYGAYAANMTGGLHWLTYGVIGAMVGLVAGKAIWSAILDKRSTIWEPVMKAIGGYVFAIIVYALVAKAWGGFDVTIADESRKIYDWQYIMGGVIGALYGMLIEADNAVPDEPKAKGKAKKLEA